MHNGQFDTLENAVGLYLGASSRARAGTLRNGINAVRGIALLPADIAPLVAFLKSLNEDYQ
jgi:cytochrome c peroxidase